MPNLTLLAELAACATDGQQPEDAMRRALSALRAGLGAADVFHVDGAEGMFRRNGTAPSLDLSGVDLWYIQRQLIEGAGSGVFRREQGRMIPHEVAEPAARDYLAALLPVSTRPAHLLVARGPWKRTRTAARTTFLQVALPLVAHLVERTVAADQARRAKDRIGRVANLYSGAAEADTLALIAKRMTNVVATLAGMDYVSIDVLGPGDVIELRRTNLREAGLPDDVRLAAREAASDWIRSTAIKTRAPVIVRDIAHDDRLSDEERAYLTRNQVRSAAAFPLLADGSVIGILGVATSRTHDFAPQDIAIVAEFANEAARVVEGVRKSRRLQEQESLLRTVAEHAPLVLFATDRHGVFTLSEGKGLERLGLRPGEVVGRSVFDVYAGDPQVVENVRRALAGEAFTGVTAVAGLAYETYYAPIIDATGVISGLIGVATDITERTRAAQDLVEQARRDSLTGLLNHASITQELDALVTQHSGDPFAVVVLDVDNLKAVNDTYGHRMGDEVLTTVAKAISRGGALAGRNGGDEFLVILPDAGRGAAARYVASVSEELAAAHLIDAETGASVPVVGSMGFAAYPVEAGTPDALIRLADAAMYAQKRAPQTGSAGMSSGRSDERAAATVGELLPLLTSSGTLEEKLRLVSHRLSVGAGYDVVMFETYTARDAQPAATNTFARLPDELLEQWNREQRGLTRRPLEDLLMQTRRAVILDDPQNDERLTEGERTIIRAAGLHSAISVPMFWQDELVGSLNVACRRANAFTPLDAQFLMSVASQVTAIMRMATLVDDLAVTSTRLEQSQADAIILLAAAAEAHDEGTGTHLQRVRVLTTALARELGHSDKDSEQLGMAAVLHDIGKIRVPDAVLMSPSQLSDVEWALMKQHTVWGADFLSSRPGFDLAANVARAHHERWDGTGYPAGLVGDEIPLAAAIVSVADALDAMTHDRPYRSGRSMQWAVSEIRAGAGAQFSPRVVDALERLHQSGALQLPHGPEEELREAA